MNNPPTASHLFPHDLLTDSARAFAASMPQAYRVHFSALEIQLHAEIAQNRGARATHVEIFRQSPEADAICVVAEDRPGLLWRVGMALLGHHLDVLKAHVYCRRRSDGRTEAVDFFFVRRTPGAPSKGRLSVDEVASIASSLEDLATGRSSTVDGAAAALASSSTEPRARDPLRVSFVRDSETGAGLLVIEAPDRPGLLLAIARALFEEDVQIVRAEVATIGSRALDTFYVMELDGGPVSAARREQIEIAARAALARVCGTSI
jgi:[protein-PII] uridylyltransferase